MEIVWNYIRCIYRSRSAIFTQTNLVWCSSWKNIRWYVIIRMWWHAWMRVRCHAWIIMIRMILVYIFYIHPLGIASWGNLRWEMFSPPWLNAEIGWCDTYVHFCYHHNYKTNNIYHDHLNDGMEKGWSETNIQFYQHHQHFLQQWTRTSGWSPWTYFHVLHHHPYYLFFGSKSVWYRKYIQLSHIHQHYLLKKSTTYPFHLGHGRNSGWCETYIYLSLQHQLFLLIAGGIGAGILWPISTPINISSAITRRIVADQTLPMFMISAINWDRVAGLLRPMSTTFTTSVTN